MTVPRSQAKWAMSRATRISGLARANLARETVREMCMSIRDSNRKFKSFAKRLLETHAKIWDELFIQFGYFFNEYFPAADEKQLPVWEKALTKTQRDDLSDRASDAHIAEEEKYLKLDLEDIARILQSDPILDKLVKVLKGGTLRWRKKDPATIESLIKTNIMNASTKDEGGIIHSTLLGDWKKIKPPASPVLNQDDYDKNQGTLRGIVRGMKELKRLEEEDESSDDD